MPKSLPKLFIRIPPLHTRAHKAHKARRARKLAGVPLPSTPEADTTEALSTISAADSSRNFLPSSPEFEESPGTAKPPKQSFALPDSPVVVLPPVRDPRLPSLVQSEACITSSPPTIHWKSFSSSSPELEKPPGAAKPSRKRPSSASESPITKAVELIRIHHIPSLSSPLQATSSSTPSEVATPIQVDPGFERSSDFVGSKVRLVESLDSKVDELRLKLKELEQMKEHYSTLRETLGNLRMKLEEHASRLKEKHANIQQYERDEQAARRRNVDLQGDHRQSFQHLEHLNTCVRGLEDKMLNRHKRFDSNAVHGKKKVNSVHGHVNEIMVIERRRIQDEWEAKVSMIRHSVHQAVEHRTVVETEIGSLQEQVVRMFHFLALADRKEIAQTQRTNNSEMSHEIDSQLDTYAKNGADRVDNAARELVLELQTLQATLSAQDDAYAEWDTKLTTLETKVIDALSTEQSLLAEKLSWTRKSPKGADTAGHTMHVSSTFMQASDSGPRFAHPRRRLVADESFAIESFITTREQATHTTSPAAVRKEESRATSGPGSRHIFSATAGTSAPNLSTPVQPITPPSKYKADQLGTPPFRG
ncbi:hypothetical protein C8R46DRAFT_1030600 [Mycena filopes]|nr:hypothetical protein C8R46DRAFT_1030600 [Mycena filopes]